MMHNMSPSTAYCSTVCSA